MKNQSTKKALIIGAGLGGLSAAIHLRLKGFEVSVYEKNSRAGGRANLFHRDGFSFDTGPSLLNYPWVFEQLFGAAGKNFYDYIQLVDVDPSVHFAWPDDTRFSLSSDLHHLITECEKLQPNSAPGLFQFFLEASKRYKSSFDKLIQKNADTYLEWIEDISVRDLLSLGIIHSFYYDLQKYFKSRYICEALGSYGMYLGGSPFDLPGIFSILPYGELAYGLTLPKGGMYSLVRAVEQLAREIGVYIHLDCPVAQIILKDAKVVAGIQLQDGTFIDCPIVVSNVDVPTTYTSLLPESKKIRSKLSRIKMTPSVLTFYWGVKGKIANLPHHTIFLPNEYKKTFRQLMKKSAIPDEISFYCSVPSATDPTLAPSGDSLVFVLVPVPVLSEPGTIDWNTAVGMVKQKVFDRFKLHNIKLEQHQFVLEEVFTPADWKNKFGLYNGSAFGASHTVLQMGPRRLKNYDPARKGLFLVGASTTPGTGVPMVVISGKLTAERVSEYAH